MGLEGLVTANLQSFETVHDDKLFDEEPDDAVWVEVDIPSFWFTLFFNPRRKTMQNHMEITVNNYF